jgi:hypothetical protein
LERLRLWRQGLLRPALQWRAQAADATLSPRKSVIAERAHVQETLTTKQCGDDLTRENVMKQAANLKDFRTTNLLPDIKINTSPIDLAPSTQVQLRRFEGERWELFGRYCAAKSEARTFSWKPAATRRGRGGAICASIGGPLKKRGMSAVAPLCGPRRCARPLLRARGRHPIAYVELPNILGLSPCAPVSLQFM